MKKYIKGIISDAKHFFVALTAKKIFAGIIILIFIAIPTLLAGYYIIDQEILLADETFSVTLYSATEKQIAEESQDRDSAQKSSLTYIFYALSANRTPPSGNHTLTDSNTYIKAEYSYKGESKALKCYFSAVEDVYGYYLDEDGNKYIIPEDIGKLFLSLPQAELFYKSAVPHTLLTVDGDKIIPTEVEWYYKTVGREYLRASSPSTSDASAVYNITGAIDISFDNAPQSCAVKIYDKDILIYEGTEDGLSSLHTDSTERLRVVIDAKWDEREDADSYGNLSYDFLVNIKNRSVFSLSTSSVPRGSFTVLDVSNVIDPSRLKVVSSDESISPQFKWYNGALRAVVYIPKEFESDSLSLDISYGASKDILSIEVFDSPVKDVFLSNYEFSNDSLAAKHFEGIKKAISSNYPSTGESVYFRGNFLNPTDIGYSPLFSDGDTLYFGEDLSYSAVTFGNQYAASFDSSVKALQGGVVAKVAFDDFLGNYVVIDHGCGLVTYYAGLDSIDVSFGDVLLTGQHLGICGKNRMGGYGFSLYCSINGSPVSPNALFEQNIK